MPINNSGCIIAGCNQNYACTDLEVYKKPTKLIDLVGFYLLKS